MNKIILTAAAVIGALTIGLGAFGAHGLKSLVTDQWVNSFNTGVLYQMFHVLALLWLGSTSVLDATQKKGVFWIWILGMLLFSGSLFIMTGFKAAGMEVGFLGPITPLGGLLLIVGWLLLSLQFYKNKLA